MIDKGKIGAFETVVSDANTAKTMKSGELDVFATPSLVAAMEAAAVSAVKDCIDSEYTTVGGGIDIKHIAPSIVGAKITATAEVVESDGKRILFKVSAHDGTGIIGEGTHERFVVNKAKFMSKAVARSESDVK